MTKEMSKNCKYFVQHAWKQDLCANCFESREDHRRKLKQLKIIVPEFAASVKSILKQRKNNQRQRKNVVFRISLTEIIGYGGDDLYDCISDDNSDNLEQNNVKNSNNDKNNNDDDDDDDDADDSDYDDDNCKNVVLTDITRISNRNTLNTDEEDRALSNLTRNNTNFNRNIANLNEPSDSLTPLSDTEKNTPKSYNNLMLGHLQNDSNGKRETLLVSVTPFGVSNNSYVISAGRSADKTPIDDEKKRIITGKINETSNLTSKSVLHQPLLKLNQTTENKCQKTSETMNTTIATKLNSGEDIIGELTLDKLKNVDMSIDDVAQNHLMINRTTVESVTLNVEQVAAKRTATEVIESLNSEQKCESPTSNTPEHNEIDNIEFNDEKIFDDTSSSSSSIDCSTTNTSGESSIVPPKPRNSFLHGGKNVNDNENPIIKLDEVNDEINSPFCTNVAKFNSATVESEELIVVKPPERLSEDLSTSIFTRKPVSSLKSDCPVVREKEKRERATSCSPKFRKMDEISLNRNYSNEIPESMSKRCATRSLSRHSSSSYSQVLSDTNGVDDEIKKKNKTRFSLKRLLRIGSSKKDLNITTSDSLVESINNIPPIPQFKSKPEIIHPLQLDGAAVEILYHDKLIKITDENTNIKSPNVKATMREPPPPPPTNVYASTKSDCPQLSTNKFTRLSLHDEQKRTNLSTHDTDSEHPTCHSICTTTTTTTTTSTVRSITADSIHTGIHNFGKFRPIQCN